MNHKNNMGDLKKNDFNFNVFGIWGPQDECYHGLGLKFVHSTYGNSSFHMGNSLGRAKISKLNVFVLLINIIVHRNRSTHF